MMETSSLKQRLQEEDAFVRKLIDTIPPKIYFNEEVNEYLENEKHEYINAGLKKYGRRGKILNVKGKLKRARLDPSLHKTVSDVQEEVEKLNAQKAKEKKSKKGTNPLLLREKLTQKIESLRSNRMGPDGPRFNDVKQRTKELKKKGNTKNKSKIVKFDAPQKIEAHGIVSTTPKVPVFNKEGKIVYSKFDFMDSHEKESEKRTSVKNKFKKALDKINHDKEKLQALSVQDPEKAENLSKKLKWKTALNKAEGIKVKDNPELLKKSLKRRDFKKKKSQKQWVARSEQVKKGMDERQAKRAKNIRAKKQQKIDKKIKLARKKGRIVNGF